MLAIAFVQYHHRRLVSNKDVHIIRYQFLWMVISQPKELNTKYLTSTILQEMYIIRKFLYYFCIPETQVMISNNKYLLRIRQFDEPI